MKTVRNGDIIATTHAVLKPQQEGDPPVNPPNLVAPKTGPSVWELLGTTCAVDQSGAFHFFWFWRAVQHEGGTPC